VQLLFDFNDPCSNGLPPPYAAAPPPNSIASCPVCNEEAGLGRDACLRALAFLGLAAGALGFCEKRSFAGSCKKGA
jgi:hypothetical protein